jgi:glucose/arabinose dehydrogenase
VSVGNYDHSFSKAAPFLQDVVSMTRSGKNLTVVASGIRQPWQMAFPKGSSTPYVTDLGADAGRAKNPPDFVLRVRPGQNYGFPKCDWTKPSRCKGFARPWQSFAPHTDPMGIGLIGDRLYLSEFIANHGTGLVVSLPKKGGTPKTLMTGFVAPVVGLGTHRGYVYVGELTGQVFRVKAR